MDKYFARNNKNFVTMIDRPGGGYNGEFNIYAELATKRTVVKVAKDDRVKVKIWNRVSMDSTDEEVTWYYNIGDTLHFTTTINKEYENIFKCDGLNIYRVKPYSPEWITIRRPVDGSDYFPLDSEYSEIRVVPLLSPKSNQVTVKVRSSDIDKFDRTYGFMANTKSFANEKYVDYYIETDGSKITGRYFDIKAKCLDDKFAPVWYEANKKDVKYMQNEYFFLGSEQPADNIIYLSCEESDEIKYSITGTAYYEEVPIGGKTVDKYWQVAPYIGILVDDTHFAYTDDNGEFATVPGNGKAGYYVKYKVVSNGVEKYETVRLSNAKQTTREYTVNYETGDETITEQIYDVNVSEILISNHNTMHPYVTGVKSLNMIGTSFGAVYINDNISVLEASVQAKKPDGSDYTYTYIDENGTEVTAVEKVKRVEFVVLDMVNRSIKKVIKATMSNANKTVWTAFTAFARGNYAEYMSGDRLYVRIVTDRKIGDGKGDDIEGSGERIEIPIFNETTYQSISTGIPFIEEAEREPFIVDIDLPRESTEALRLPIIGQLGCMLNMKGMSFGITMDGDRMRLYFGKKFNGGGNRYGMDGKTMNDAGNTDVTLGSFRNQFDDMKNQINNSGKQRLKTMTLGIPSWTFEPIVGIYFEFMLSFDPDAKVETQYEFTGGGGYFGGILDLRYTFYFLVYGIPFYVGGNVNISLVAEMGIAVDKEKRIPFNDPTQGFFDSLFKNSHFEFLIRSIMYASAYVGVGVAGSIGARGGFQLILMFIWNPTVKQKYNNVRPIGMAVTGGIRIWLDAGFMSIPIPVYTWKKPLTLGYFKDIEEVYNHDDENSNYDKSIARTKDAGDELKTIPRFGGNSKFVANKNRSDNLFGGTYVEESTRTLVEGVYDDAEPIMIEYANSSGMVDRALLIYLDDEATQDDLDRTTLKWTTDTWTTKTWSEPRKVWEDNNTADFSPTVCKTNDDKILLAWAKRPDPVDENTDKADLLKKMEIYTITYDCELEQFESAPTRMTNDNSYDYYPRLSYNKTTGQTYLYYLKNDNVGEINNGEDLLNNIQPEINGAHLMYMLYDDVGDGNGARWLTDYYYDTEFSYSMTDAEKEAFINNWHGQRIKDLSINIGGNTRVNNDPNISDYVVEESSVLVATEDDWSVANDLYRELMNNRTTAAFNAVLRWTTEHINEYNVCAYVVDDDGDVNTKDDTELYLKLKMATSSNAYTIRLTNNSVPDMIPKILKVNSKTYIFWIQNESAIKMIELTDIVRKAQIEEHENEQIEVGEINVITTDKMILSDKITNYALFKDTNGNIYIAWQQDSKTDVDNFEDFEDTGEIEFRQDLYVAGLIETTDNDGEQVRTWSNPVRFTDNGKVNNLPTVASFGNNLVLVNNQYNLKSSGESYVITNSNLQEILYKTSSSLEVNSIMTEIDTVNDDESIKYRAIVGLQNTGLFLAGGFNYSGKITYDGKEIATINGSTNEKVLPGNETKIGGYSAEESVTNPIYFTLNKEQQHHLDKVKLILNVDEHNAYDDGIVSTKDVFDVKETFDFVVVDGSDTAENYTNLSVEQDGDTFIVKGILENTGNIDSNGDEKIYVIDQDDWSKDIASSDYIDLKMNGQLQFEIPIDRSIISEFPMGVKDLVVYVKNDAGDILSTYEIATINARNPFNFKVNGNTDKIKVKVGETLKLNTTFEPSDRYRSATILYSVEDSNVARSGENEIYGVAEGTTKLRLTTKEFGGSKTIEVNVVPNENNGGGSISYRSGGSSGGGGNGPAIQLDTVVNTTNVNIVKGNPLVIDNSANNVRWIYDVVTNKFRLNAVVNGGVISATNGFYTIKDVKEQNVNGIVEKVVTEDTYYFDQIGNMVTGWIKTLDNKWYFFENLKTMNEGKMVVGWKKIENIWYYFMPDGSMLTNAITPDGFRVGADGGFISNVYIPN